MALPRHLRTAEAPARAEPLTPTMNAHEGDEVRGLGARVAAVFAAPGYSPPLLPAVALELHNLAGMPNVDVKRVVALLETDAVLAADVLRRAQSALYASGSAVTSLQAAVMRMGLNGLRDVVWEVAMSTRVFRAKQFASEMNQLRAHATATAHLAKLVASRTTVPVEYAFMAGLMHDIGAVAIVIVANDELKPAPDPALLTSVIKTQHEQASGAVARLWKLPADLQSAFANHHTVVVDGVISPMPAIIAIAEALAQNLGAPGPAGMDAGVPESLLAASLTALRLGDAQVQALVGEAEQLMQKLPAAG